MLENIRQQAHERFLSARAIDRIVNSEDFARYLAKSTEADQLAAVQIVSSGNKEELETWMYARRKEFDYAALSIHELRQLASQLWVRNYGRLPKANLILEIESAQSRISEEVEQVHEKTPAEPPGWWVDGTTDRQVHR